MDFLQESKKQFALLALILLILPVSPVHAQVTRSLQAGDIGDTAHSLGIGEELRLSGFSLGDQTQDRNRRSNSESDTLVLKRFRVFAKDARIVVYGEQEISHTLPPKNAYFRGHIEGDALSRAYVVFLQDGSTRGLISRDKGYWIMNSADPAARNQRIFQQIDDNFRRSTENNFACETDGVDSSQALLERQLSPRADFRSPAPSRGASNTEYDVKIALDTDYQFLQLFGGSTNNATNYIGDLIAYSSIIFNTDLNTNLVISDIKLRTSSNDPWSDSLFGSCQLFEFGRYWNNNYGNVDRTISHLLSGRKNGSSSVGTAWIGVLCRSGFNVSQSCSGLSPETSNYGGAYGVTQGLNGNFNINNPQVIWDIAGLSHEIGHNFNSPHTQCYKNIGGNSNPVDACSTFASNGYSCHSGTIGLPGINSLLGGSTSNRPGTLMSYCHHRSGGYGNVSLNFGRNHNYGIQADRVPDRMRDHVEIRADIYPSCIVETTDAVLIISGFE